MSTSTSYTNRLAGETSPYLLQHQHNPVDCRPWGPEALAEAKRRGQVSAGCDSDAAARFLVASLEGAILLTKLSKDIGVMEQCVGELKRYLATYEVTA